MNLLGYLVNGDISYMPRLNDQHNLDVGSVLKMTGKPTAN